MDIANEYSSKESIQQKVRRHFQDRGGSGSSLRMAPMIDVIFLMLTFFVLTAKFRIPEQFLSVLLAQADASSQMINIAEPLGIHISACENGSVIGFSGAVKGEDVEIRSSEIAEDLTAFANSFARVMDRQKRTSADPVEIFCGDQVKWDHLVKIYNVLFAMGISDITFTISD